MTILKPRSFAAAMIFLIAIAFGVLTIREGGAFLFHDAAARAAAGGYVPCVLWCNLVAGFACAIAGAGRWMRQRWARWLAVAIAAAATCVFAASGPHVYSGGAYEQRAVVAMSVRVLVWMGIATPAWRLQSAAESPARI